MYLQSAAVSLTLVCSITAAQAEWSAELDRNATIWKDVSSSFPGPSSPNSRIAKRQSTWNPPPNLVTPLKQVWDHEVSTYSNALGFKNYGYDQIMANKGSANLRPLTPHPPPNPLHPPFTNFSTLPP